VTYSPWVYSSQKPTLIIVTRPREIEISQFGNLLRNHRRNAGISQEQLAERSGLDRTYISGIERGLRNPTLTALLKIAKGLDISISMLLQDLERSEAIE
jgi:transcriptional regulator with XRE-family HTH domain